MKHLSTVCCVVMLLVGAAVWGQTVDQDLGIDGLTFYASFNDGPNAEFSRGDGAANLRERTTTEGPRAIIETIPFVQGVRGMGLQVDNRYVEYPGGANLNPSTATVNLWLQPVNWTPDDDLFHCFFTTSKTADAWIILYKYMRTGTDAGISRQTAFYVEADPGEANLRDKTMVHVNTWDWQPGEWHMLTGSWSEEGVEFYIDGTLVARASGGAVPREPFEKLLVGEPWQVSDKQTSVIDEVRIFDRALEAKEVRRLYADGVRHIVSSGQQVPGRRSLRGDFLRFFTENVLALYADASLLAEHDPANLAVNVTVTAAGGDTPLLRDEMPALDSAGEAHGRLDVSSLEPGAYKLRLTAVERGSNRPVSGVTLDYEHLARPPWYGLELGQPKRLLPPYVPLEVNTTAGATTISPWGRDYAFSSVLPAQMTVHPDPNAAIAAVVETFHHAAELLAMPMQLSAGETALSADAAEINISQQAEAVVTIHAAQRAGQLLVEATHDILQDGIIQTRMTITPQGNVELPSLQLGIPLKSRYVKYVNFNSQDGLHFNGYHGGLPEGEGVVMDEDYKPLIWLGDEYRGLCWFSDTSRGWKGDLNARGRIRVVRDGDVTWLELNLATAPLRLTDPLVIEFCLAATPLRPLPQGWRGFLRAGTTSATPARNPAEDRVGVPPKFLVWWSNPGVMQNYAYPVPSIDDETQRELWRMWDGVSDIVHHWPNGTWEEGEWSRLFYPEWANRSTQELLNRMGGRPQTGGRVDWHTSIVDFWLWSFDHMMANGLDGAYIDDPYLYPSFNDRAGGAWVDEEGRLRPNYGMMALRDYMRRLYSVALEHTDTPWMDLHMSNQLMLPFYGFFDSFLNGEHIIYALRGNPHYVEELPRDKIKAQYLGYQWGLVPYILPELPASEYRDGGPATTREMLAVVLPHDISIWRAWAVFSELEKAMRGTKTLFGVGEADCTFLPYWEAGEIIRGQHDMLVCSAYLRTGRALLVIGNWTDEAVETDFALDLAALGLSETVTATDIFEQDQVAFEDGRVRVTVPARNYRMVLVAQQ